MALMAYLERNPHIEQISICLDNDDAGQRTAVKLFQTLANPPYEHIAVTIDLPEGRKDYNDILLQSITLDKDRKQSSLRKEAVSSL